MTDEASLRNLLSQNIKRLRKRRGLSQATLAEKANMATSYISDIETGRYGVSLAALVSLANSLEVEVFELFKPQEAISEDTLGVINKYLDDISESLTISLASSIRKIRKNL